MKRKPRPDDLIVVPGWEHYLNHVRESRHRLRQRVSQINLHLAEFRAATRGLSLGELGAFVAVLEEYANSPLLAGESDARGRRQCTYSDARAACLARRGARESHLVSLLERRCVALIPADAWTAHATAEQSGVELSRAELSRAETYVDDDGYVVER